MISFASILFVWEFICRHPGLLLVLLGVVGEIICDWKEMGVGRLARAKKISAILLVIGLSVEFVEAAKSDEKVSKTELQVQELRNQNIALETELQWRTITEAQRKIILDSLDANLQFKPKCKVQIVVQQGDAEAVSFMQEISDVLSKAGFEVEMQAPLTFFDAKQPVPTGWQIGVKSNFPAPDGANEIVEAFLKAGLKPISIGVNPSAPDGGVLIQVFHKPHNALK